MTTENTEVTERYQGGDYLAKNSDWHVEDSSWKADQIHKIVSRNNLHFSTICEVGCGAGEILRQLSIKSDYEGVNFVGYEVSADAFKLCKQRESETVKFHLKDILREDVRYDAILCIDVFEHIENYMGFLKMMNSKSEYKIFHIPLDLSVVALMRDTLIKGRESVGHLHYFTPSTALATLEDCGYEVLDTMYTPFFADLQPKSLKAKIVKIPRTILYRFSPKLMSTLMGGASLMVLAK